MIPRERRQLLLAELARTGSITTSDFAARIGVTEVTVRSDLDRLEALGRLTRTHGGAVIADGVAPPTGFEDRLALRREAKHRIGAAAAGLLSNHETVILDAGSTVYQVAASLPEVTGLTVVTPSLPVAQQLMRSDGVTVRLVGGKVYPNAVQTIGSPAELGVDHLLAHHIFLGTQGIDSDMDFGEQEWELIEMKRALLSKARRVVLLADSSKFGRAVEVKLASLRSVDLLITDDEAPTDALDRARTLGCDVMVV